MENVTKRNACVICWHHSGMVSDCIDETCRDASKLCKECLHTYRSYKSTCPMCRRFFSIKLTAKDTINDIYAIAFFSSVAIMLSAILVTAITKD